MWEIRVRSLGREDPVVKEVATHSSTLPGKSHGGARQATVHGVTNSRTLLSDFTKERKTQIANILVLEHASEASEIQVAAFAKQNLVH